MGDARKYIEYIGLCKQSKVYLKIKVMQSSETNLQMSETKTGAFVSVNLNGGPRVPSENK